MSGIVKPQVLASLNRSHPLAVGLEAYWPFLEGSGGTVADYSGAQRHGTLTNMAPDERWVGGEDGGALYCNALAGYVDTPVIPSLWTGFSFLAVCTSLAPGNLTYILVGNSGAIVAQEVFYLQRIDYKMAFALKLNGVDTWQPVISSVNMPSGYCVIVATYDGTSIKLYQNGAQVGSRSYTGTVNSTTQNIELGHWKGTRFWYGNISLGAVWSRGLSEQEVTTLTADPYCLLRPAVQDPWLYYTAPTSGRAWLPILLSSGRYR